MMETTGIGTVFVNSAPMRIFLLFLIVLFTSDLRLVAQPGATANPNGPIITFENPVIIDSLPYDSAGYIYNPSKKYNFKFTNTGKEPLIVGYSAGSDPDYNCDYTKDPVS